MWIQNVQHCVPVQFNQIQPNFLSRHCIFTSQPQTILKRDFVWSFTILMATKANFSYYTSHFITVPPPSPPPPPHYDTASFLCISNSHPFGPSTIHSVLDTFYVCIIPFNFLLNFQISLSLTSFMDIWTLFATWTISCYIDKERISRFYYCTSLNLHTPMKFYVFNTWQGLTYCKIHKHPLSCPTEIDLRQTFSMCGEQLIVFLDFGSGIHTTSIENFVKY